MRITFVGKGGSGKSTLAASFASYIPSHTTKTVMVFDADLNIHVPELLGFGKIAIENHISQRVPAQTIQKWLIGKNSITNLGAFRKTTPPTQQSNILKVEKLKESPLFNFAAHKNNLFVFAVGTYQEDDIGASCYHNSLAILESLLNHTDDKNGYVIADMVAGVDSFAGTLHAQFDLTCFVVEPTKRSVEVYEKYKTLAEEAGIFDSVIVIGNKVQSETDKQFILSYIGEEKLHGYFAYDEHIRHIDQAGGAINVDVLREENKKLLISIYEKLNALSDTRNDRLKKIWELHKKYVAQAFIHDRYGDLAHQIDPEFSFD